MDVFVLQNVLVQVGFSWPFGQLDPSGEIILRFIWARARFIWARLNAEICHPRMYSDTQGFQQPFFIMFNQKESLILWCQGSFLQCLVVISLRLWEGESVGGGRKGGKAKFWSSSQPPAELHSWADAELHSAQLSRRPNIWESILLSWPPPLPGSSGLWWQFMWIGTPNVRVAVDCWAVITIALDMYLDSNSFGHVCDTNQLTLTSCWNIIL